MTYQPRYEAFLRAEGTTPEQEEARWPGGCNTGFILWITEQWREWDASTGHRGSHGPAEHEAFDKWLVAR